MQLFKFTEVNKMHTIEECDTVTGMMALRTQLQLDLRVIKAPAAFLVEPLLPIFKIYLCHFFLILLRCRFLKFKVTSNVY